MSGHRLVQGSRLRRSAGPGPAAVVRQLDRQHAERVAADRHRHVRAAVLTVDLEALVAPRVAGKCGVGVFSHGVVEVVDQGVAASVSDQELHLAGREHTPELLGSREHRSRRRRILRGDQQLREVHVGLRHLPEGMA
ncbi:MAG TPA: hypothetical protein VFW55_05210 [Propionicimonas sp.]|nr:hypothetical protein [Propionicimonas sp.]